MIKHIHPFPARMAPDIALEHVQQLPKNALVADPMCGSGTVLRVAAECGYRCVGFDLDPLAVLMSRVWTTPVDTAAIRRAASDLMLEAKSLRDSKAFLPWVDNCDETTAFIERWFELGQRVPLRRLAYLLASKSGPIADVLRLALSRTIITKERGASIARDTSHSRPHTWFIGNTYDVWKGYQSAVDRLLTRLHPEELNGDVVVNLGDARDVEAVPSGSVDAIITSPPYLNAIDYLRGHKLALVWLGYNLRTLRSIRSTSVGTEKAAHTRPTEVLEMWLDKAAGGRNALPKRERGMLQRYAEDVSAMIQEYRRLLKRGGKLTLVVGNSRVRGTFVENSMIVELAAAAASFSCAQKTTRDLPSASRYLPISRGVADSALENRMKEEVVLQYEAA